MSLILNYHSSTKGMVDYTVNGGTKLYSRKYKKDGTFSHDGFSFQYIPEEKTINMLLDKVVHTKALQPLKPEFSINQRFGFLEKFTSMVLDRETASAIVTGEGGLGKSWVVLSQLESRNLVENKDYIIVKGYATPKALYATLHEHNGKIIIFDDCDSVLKDPTALNLLKGALDSYDKRIISWLTKGFIDDGLPSSFEFTGRIIFISNLSSDKIDQAVKSRSITIDLSMSIEDKIERMYYILPTVLSDYSMDLKTKALDFLALHAYEAVELNMRTLQQVIKVVHAYGIETDDWKDAVKYLLTHV